MKITNAIRGFVEACLEAGLERPPKIVLASHEDWRRLWHELDSMARIGKPISRELSTLYVLGVHISSPDIEAAIAAEHEAQGRDGAYRGLSALAQQGGYSQGKDLSGVERQ